MKVATSIKLDKDIKEGASKLASDLGLNLSSVINATLKKFISDKSLTVSLPQDVPENIKKDLRIALKEIRDKKNLVGPFNSIEELKKSLVN